MRSKLRSNLTTTRVLVVLAALVIAVTWALPAVGASPLKLAKKALTKAKTADATANAALAKANGIPLGARAYARIDGSSCATSSACPIDHSKGITAARGSSTGGLYCITAGTLSQATNSWLASVDAGDTGANVSDAQAAPNSNNAGCNSTEFEVQTTRIGGANATDISFFFVIP
jgi:hypothetical protein